MNTEEEKEAEEEMEEYCLKARKAAAAKERAKQRKADGTCRVVRRRKKYDSCSAEPEVDSDPPLGNHAGNHNLYAPPVHEARRMANQPPEV